MANYSNLKNIIDQVVRTNGQGDITGANLNQTLQQIVTDLGANYQYAGVATPSTNPGSPDQNVFYIATLAGTYFYFNDIVLPKGITVLRWDGSWSSTTLYTVDTGLTPDSEALVQSGTVFEKFKFDGGPWDVSAHFPTAGPNNGGKFTLEYILSNANTLIPETWRKGGMSIRFVSSTDNKYVQCRCMAQNFTTDVTQWQGVDDEPIDESKNLVISRGVYQAELNSLINCSKPLSLCGYYYNSTSRKVVQGSDLWNGFIIYLEKGITEFYLNIQNNKNIYYANYFNSLPQLDDAASGTCNYSTISGYKKVSIDSNVTGIYVLCTLNLSNCPISNCYAILNTRISVPAIDDRLTLAEEKIEAIENNINGSRNFVVQQGERLAQTYTLTELNGFVSTWKFKLDTTSTEYATYAIWAKNSLNANLGHVDASIGEWVDFVLPSNTDKIFVFVNKYASVDTNFTLSYVCESQVNIKIDELENSIEEISQEIDNLEVSTVNIKEDGSDLSQDEINLISEKSKKLAVNNTNCPIVAFVFDDDYNQDYVDLFVERNIKITFAIIGNINKNNWSTDANKIRALIKNGHGTIAHGIVNGITVTGHGVDTMNDADVKKATEGENKAFDDYKFSHRGLVQYGTWSDNPHTWSLMGNYYDYIIGVNESMCINTPASRDLYQIKRMWTDYPNRLSNQKAKVDEAIATGDCLLVFGGHFSRTGHGGEYSTMEEFTALLDYVKQKIDDGLMVSMNTDDAIDCLWGRAAAHNVIKYANYDFRNPILNACKIDSGVLKRCTNQGTKAIYKLTLSGTPSTGSVNLYIGEGTKTTDISINQSITISTESGQTIEDVVNTIVSKIYKAYTVRKSNVDEIILYRDINGVTFMPHIDNNTSGLLFSFELVTSGTEATWI